MEASPRGPTTALAIILLFAILLGSRPNGRPDFDT